MIRSRIRRLRQITRWLSLLLILGAVGIAAFYYGRWLYRERRFNALIEEIATRQEADKFLIKAVMRQESGFDPFAYSSRGAIGLMQVTESAGLDWAAAVGRHDFGRDLLWDARINIEAGTWYLARALRRWQHQDDPVPFALAEYNAGLGNVRRWLPRGRDTTAAEFQAAITWPGVRAYIERVTGYYRAYQEGGQL